MCSLGTGVSGQLDSCLRVYVCVHVYIHIFLSAFTSVLVYVSGPERTSTKENEKWEAINFGWSSTLLSEKRKKENHFSNILLIDPPGSHGLIERYLKIESRSSSLLLLLLYSSGD